MATIVIIQARMGSDRLPGKVLKPLGESTVLDYVVKRSSAISGVDRVVVATSTSPGDQAIEDWCQAHSYTCFRGPEDDVLSRYSMCAQKFKAKSVLRVTADCPFLDYEAAGDALDRFLKSHCDFVKPLGPQPRGLNVEIFSHQALKKVAESAQQAYEREHVTIYAKQNPHQFRWLEVESSPKTRHPQLRITLDTPEDYDLLFRIATHFRGQALVSSGAVIELLLNKPELAKINAHIQQKSL